MRFVGEENISSGLALNIEEEIVKKWGPMIIVQAASRVDSVNEKVRNGFWSVQYLKKGKIHKKWSSLLSIVIKISIYI